MNNRITEKLKFIIAKLPVLAFCLSFCVFMIALALKTKVHEAMQLSAVVSLFYLITSRRHWWLLANKYFLFAVTLALLIFFRPNNMFLDYKFMSYMLLGLIIGITSRLTFDKWFYHFNLLFPLAFIFNIVFLMYRNPKLSFIDQYNVIYGNKNVFGYFLAIAMISIFAAIPKFKYLTTRVLLFLISFIYFVINMLNGMRSGTIGIGLALLSLLFWKSRKKIMPYLFIMLVSTLIIIPFIPKEHYERYVSLKVVNDVSYTGRFKIWSSAIEQIKKAPMWGTANWTFDPQTGGSHNLFLDGWVNYGLILGSLLNIYLVYILIYAIREKDVWCVTVLIALFTINQVESFLETSWCAGYFYYISGAALANRYMGTDEVVSELACENEEVVINV